MRRFADIASFVWLTLVFAALAASVGGCPYTRYVWSAQFVALWLVAMGVIGVFNSGAWKRDKQS